MSLDMAGWWHGFKCEEIVEGKLAELIMNVRFLKAFEKKDQSSNLSLSSNSNF